MTFVEIWRKRKKIVSSIFSILNIIYCQLNYNFWQWCNEHFFFNIFELVECGEKVDGLTLLKKRILYNIV